MNLKLAAKVSAIASGIDKRFSAPGDGTVRDSQTGLLWAQRDNGNDINWNNARSYCSNLSTAGGSWQLPSMDELQGIYDGSATLQTQCGGSSCQVSPLFGLSSNWFLSNQLNGSAEAWGFFLSHGVRYSYDVWLGGGRRALCVRRGS